MYHYNIKTHNYQYFLFINQTIFQLNNYLRGVENVILNARMKIIMSAILVSVIALIAAFSGSLYDVPASAQEETEIAVIMYHGFVKDKSFQNKYMISPSYFESDLRYLTENGYHTIFISELTDHLENNAPLPDKPVILTFDDGYYNNYAYAYPLLKKYNCKAVISPIGKPADDAKDETVRNAAYSQCKWSELAEMQQSGLVEIQNHTYDLHKINGNIQGLEKQNGETDTAYEKRISEDILKFNKRMEEELSLSPTALTLPFGAGRTEVLNIADKLGFKAVLDCEEKINHLSSGDTPYIIHRFLRPNDISSEEFFTSLPH